MSAVPAISTGAAVALLACALAIFALQIYLFYLRLQGDTHKQKFVGVAMLVMLLVLGVLCYRFNYWPGITPRYRPANATIADVQLRRPERPVLATIIVIAVSLTVLLSGAAARILIGQPIIKLAAGGFLIMFAMLFALGGYVLWLSWITTASLAQIFTDPPSVIVLAIFGWFVALFCAGVGLGHWRMARR